ncbi:hypothetical protein APT96_01575 [Proteus mirabilis]|nr:hypothetical protein APT96_01575 [Proteus mirabilis]NAC33051.1 hypothetical protein [Escherichia coli]MTS87677.1 hypothetical protein [Proteus mirabilis]MTS98668.1 hypothetical protein [Proteus mirabilis]MTT04980.1 hypothetical protein [Proteus mirabilis]
MLNKNDRDKLIKNNKYKNIKFNVKCNIQVILFIALISFIFLNNQNLPLKYKIAFSGGMIAFIYIFSAYHSFGSLYLANKITFIFIKIKIKKLITFILRK